AKDLVKACDAGTIGQWAHRWIAALGEDMIAAGHPRARQTMDRAPGEVAEFAARHLSGDCKLAKAQFILARSHGFTTWPRFAEHIERLKSPTDQAAFEAAADAIIAGDEAKLGALLSDHPDLVRAKSAREHGATLLVYTAANGVEGYRQVTPPNIV